MSRLLFVDFDNRRLGRRLALPGSTYRGSRSVSWANPPGNSTLSGRANLPVSLFSETRETKPLINSIIVKIIMRLTSRFALADSGSHYHS